MKVLVTGGAGFIGSNITRLLLEQGHTVVILDNFSHASYRNIIGLDAELIVGDVTDESLYAKLPKVDAIIHEAAITDTTLPDDITMMAVNFNGFKNILHHCLKKKIKLVYASSAAVYGDGPSPMSETQPAQPMNTYGYSKYMCDVYARPFMNKKGNPLIVGVRYFNVYGPYEWHKGLAASMTYQLYCQMKKGKRPRVFKFGEQRRDFIYVKDVARITVGALDLAKGTVLNVGTGKPGSYNDIIAALNKAMKKNLKPDYFDNPFVGVYQDFTQAEVKHLKKCGFSADFTLARGIADYVKTYL